VPCTFTSLWNNNVDIIVDSGKYNQAKLCNGLGLLRVNAVKTVSLMTVKILTHL
jgi:hypothetical protein